MERLSSKQGCNLSNDQLTLPPASDRHADIVFSSSCPSLFATTLKGHNCREVCGQEGVYLEKMF